MRRRRLIPAVLGLACLCGCGAPRATVSSVDWVVMGTVARVSVKDVDANRAAEVRERARAIARRVYAEVEERLSAWRGDSELMRLAPLDETNILAQCAARMRPCYAAAFELMHRSGGAFNPRWRGPKTLDFGAIAKGFAVDLAAEEILREASIVPETGILLDLGGNLKAVRGTWHTGVRDPARADAVCRTFELAAGAACATSAEYARGKHICDGRTGRPAANGTVAVTVVDRSSAMLADGLSTLFFVLGKNQGEEYRHRHHPTAVAYWTVSEARDANDSDILQP